MNRKQRREQSRKNRGQEPPLKMQGDTDTHSLALAFMGAWTHKMQELTMQELESGKSQEEVLANSNHATDKAIAYARSHFADKETADRAQLAFMDLTKDIPR